MQRRPPPGIAAIHECCIFLEQVADSLDIVILRGQMNGMIFSRRNRFAAPAELIEEKSGDLVMTPLPGDLDQAVGVPFGICVACVEGARVEILHEGIVGRDPIAVRVDNIQG